MPVMINVSVTVTGHLKQDVSHVVQVLFFSKMMG
jgi:hypothetical protein